MNFMFLAVTGYPTGLFGLAFSIFGVLHSRSWGEGKLGKAHSKGTLRMALLLVLLGRPSSTIALPPGVVKNVPGERVQ